jgi:hypothetical protein
MRKFLVQGRQAEKKGVENLCLPINIVELAYHFKNCNIFIYLFQCVQYRQNR